ncbi:MAG: FAD-dependent oxidoreductase [Bacteroidota bacterium]
MTHRVAVCERHPTAGRETSSRNSGVIHSGIHLSPDSNKAGFARRGKELVVAFCQDHAVRLEKVGMHILVAGDDLLGLWPETRRLVQMLKRARAQQIKVSLVSSRTIRRREPCVHGLFGLHIPDVYIVDPNGLVNALCDEAKLRSVDFHFSSEVRSISPDNAGWRVMTDEHEFTARMVINAAGLCADRVASLAGFSHQQFFYRGEYYRIHPDSGLYLNGLVYPVHQPGKPGLGVHLTRTINGDMLIGPNARRVSGPDEYLNDPTPAEAFYRDVKKFLPELELAHLLPHPAGIRPKLTDAPGENNFRIVWERTKAPFLNLIGIESPGLTAAMAIAESIRGHLKQVHWK